MNGELTYSFRQYRGARFFVNPENTALSSIEQLLLEAADAYTQRNYSEAIKLYKQLRSLLWSQLFQSSPLIEKVAWKADLTKALISYSGEWLNVLEVEQVASGVQPRVTVDEIENAPMLGLNSGSIGVKESRAIADLETAELLTQQGNKKSAQFFQNRAMRAAPEFVKKLEETIDDNAEPAVPNRAGVNRPLNTLERGALFGRNRPELISRINNDVTLARRLQPLSFPLLANKDRSAIPPSLTVEERSYSAKVGDQVKSIRWAAGEAPAVNDIVTSYYDARRHLKQLPDVLIRPERESDVAISLAHAWYYESALGLAECYHALGDWSAAETWYKRVANYQYLNVNIEVPYVWSKLATLYLDWGNALFREQEPSAALAIYEKVLTLDNHPGNSSLYTVNTIKAAADVARHVIDNLATPDNITASPAISTVIFEIQAQLAKIAGGLDFWGHWGTNVPIWTFDYLQSVATNFCQLAIGAERDAINFWEKSERGELTRLQLTQNVTLSQAERDAAQRRADAAMAERDAYVLAVDAARLRAQNARATASSYAAKSAQWIMHQALSAQLSGGEDGDASELNSLADQMMQGSYSISGDRGTLAAAESLTAARLQREHEIDRLNRQADELEAALAQAEAELEATRHRVAAAQASVNAASVRVQSAEALLDSFEDQRFTPEVWHQLGEKINQLAQRYLFMALDVAKRMQRSYNFENDVSRSIIKSDYSTETVNGLLAADTLMADVQSFTFDQITSTAPKPQTIKQTISLAQNYPYLFETQFRATGRMEFQTSIDDFDLVYPGSYAGRVEHVEVEIDGIVPTRGISGTLSNSGISHYRLPSGLWSPGTSGLKHRVQLAETQVLSDYDIRSDIVLTDTDRRRRRVFEGAGVASSWTLEIPPMVNTLDYAHIVDVRLTFTYEARFDPNLKQGVLSDLNSRPGAHQRQRPLPLRWLFPDAFFSFYQSGRLEFSLGQGEFAATEGNPLITELGLLVTTSPRAQAAGIVLQINTPDGNSSQVTTNSEGIVPASQLAAVAGIAALGEYAIVIDAADNPSWVVDGQLDVDSIQNIAVVVSYSYTPRM